MKKQILIGILCVSSLSILAEENSIAHINVAQRAIVTSDKQIGPCISGAQMRDYLSLKFKQGQTIIRRNSLSEITWNLASFYKSKPEETFQYERLCCPISVFYDTLTSSTVGEHFITALSGARHNIKWAFYSDDIMMELVKYNHSGLPSRGIRCKMVATKTTKEKIICQNNAGSGKVAYSCFVKNLSTEASSCFSD